MYSIDMYYTATFGKGDGSDRIDYCIELTDEELEEFKNTVNEKNANDDLIEFWDLPQSAIDRAISEIEDIERENYLSWGEEPDDESDPLDDISFDYEIGEYWYVCSQCGELFEDDEYDIDLEDEEALCPQCRGED